MRVSVSHKDKDSGSYVVDFSGYVTATGTATAKKASGLKESDTIKLGDVDVLTKYDEKKKATYTNYRIYTFDIVDNKKQAPERASEPQPTVDNGEVEDSRLPF